ncbi:glycoside hydrolase family 3 N-terminal domain-containing protein [Hymenobacter negativus]|uniref:beta-glucosidase n=1 Tax=Hymenobacter negativus TaxID=2795026 RepID=A0ABS3QIQ1_9BACT|nr:glycoside hydrolase family 3 N-terminal domain-containing protein [Hymenobacter negativus]MBO2010600.1 glycoside hydrolase family 3 C-terminal domain-containing protein [Hymenobacter negativus]
MITFFNSIGCLWAPVQRVLPTTIVRRAHWKNMLLALPLLAACQRAVVPTTASTPVPISPVTPATPELPITSFSPRVQQLLAQMTLEEKIGQMTQLNLSAINHNGTNGDVTLDSAKAAGLVRDFHIGSFLNGEAVPAMQWLRYSAALQRIAVRESRLHIPMIYGIDHMHGASYVSGTAIFPHNINLGASFNPELAKQAARATIMESADLGHHWVFAPVLDLGVNTYWPRFYETYGEDPLVAATLGEAFVREMQTNTEIAPYKVAACGKHFLGYSDPRNGWDRTNALIPDQRLQEFFRPSFQAAIDSGLKSIMINSGEINGEPVHASKAILTDLLRRQMGFKGVAVTDWEDIIRLVRIQKTAANEKEATWMAIDAGVDMAMTPYNTNFCRIVKELVQEGRLTQARIDLSAGRILQLKDEIGLFENPMPRADRLSRIGDPAFRAQAVAAARESVVLLKNEKNTLPLAPSRVKRLLVVGPSANSRANLCGGWTLAWQGRPEEAYPTDVPTLLEALRQEYPQAKVELMPYYDKTGKMLLATIASAAKQADAVVLALGERPYTEGIGNTSDLTLPDDQQQLTRTVQASGKPTVVVMIGGRPNIIRSISEGSSAIIWAGLPGYGGGTALAEIISGKTNPSGKLPFTYPQFAGHITNYHHDNNENSLDLSDFGAGFEQRAPKYKSSMLTEFGEGMSYTTYTYSNLALTDSVLNGPSSRLRATVRVANTGARAGQETALWFLTDEVGRVARPVRMLKHFDKQEFAAGQSRELTFDIDPLHDLSYPDGQGRPQLETGWYTLRVGSQTARFRYVGGPVARNATTPDGSTGTVRPTNGLLRPGAATAEASPTK